MNKKIFWISTVVLAGMYFFTTGGKHNNGRLTSYNGQSCPTVETSARAVIYTVDWCSNCKRLKSMLDNEHADYFEINVEASKENMLAFHCAGGESYPHFVLDGKIVDISSGRELHDAIKTASQ